MPDLSQETGALLRGWAAGAAAMIRPAALLAVAVGAGVLAADLSGLAIVAPPALAQRTATTQETQEAQEKPVEPAAYRLADLTIGGVWAHQPSSRDGAAYLRIGNAGKDDDALIDASAPIAKRVELRGPVPGGKLGETGRVDAIPAPARQVTDLTVMVLHLRLVGLRSNLRVGETVNITLTFEQAGAITVEARVLSANDAAAIIERTMSPAMRPETPAEPDARPAPPAVRQ